MIRREGEAAVDVLAEESRHCLMVLRFYFLSLPMDRGGRSFNFFERVAKKRGLLFFVRCLWDFLMFRQVCDVLMFRQVWGVLMFHRVFGHFF